MNEYRAIRMPPSTDSRMKPGLVRPSLILR